MANKVRSILQVVDHRGNYGVMTVERDLDSDKVFVAVTAVDTDNHSVDIEKGIVHDVYDIEMRKHLSVWDFNTAEAPSNV